MNKNLTIEMFNLFQDCVNEWGSRSQILMLIEELTELSLVLSHLLRINKPVNMDHLIEEMSDVKLMMDQLQFIYNISDADLNKMRNKKIERLKGLLKHD